MRPKMFSLQTRVTPHGVVGLDAPYASGLCISELIAALVRKDVDGVGRGKDYRGLMNTAWTRVTVGIKVRLL